jgi:hypothetical protein
VHNRQLLQPRSCVCGPDSGSGALGALPSPLPFLIGSWVSRHLLGVAHKLGAVIRSDVSVRGTMLRHLRCWALHTLTLPCMLLCCNDAEVHTQCAKTSGPFNLIIPPQTVAGWCWLVGARALVGAGCLVVTARSTDLSARKQIVHRDARYYHPTRERAYSRSCWAVVHHEVTILQYDSGTIGHVQQVNGSNW